MGTMKLPRENKQWHSPNYGGYPPLCQLSADWISRTNMEHFQRQIFLKIYIFNLKISKSLLQLLLPETWNLATPKQFLVLASWLKFHICRQGLTSLLSVLKWIKEEQKLHLISYETSVGCSFHNTAGGGGSSRLWVSVTFLISSFRSSTEWYIPSCPSRIKL